MIIRLLVTYSAAILLAASASAGLVGTNVTGTLQFAANPTNYFDPANGLVPAGYLNTGGPTVLIGAGIEFGFADAANRDVANFTDTQLIVTDDVFDGASNWKMTFTNSAFTSLSLLSSDFVPGLTSSLVGDVITIEWAGSGSLGLRTAVFDVGSGSTGRVPDTGTSPALMGLALLGLVAVRRKLA